MTFPANIPPDVITRHISEMFGADSGPRVSIDAGRLPCEDTFIECPECERHWEGHSIEARFQARQIVPLRFNRFGWGVAHPIRPEVVSEHVEFGLWVGECGECGAVFFGERRIAR